MAGTGEIAPAPWVEFPTTSPGGWFHPATRGAAFPPGVGFLASRPGWVYTRYQIVDAVRGPEHNVTDRSIDVHIAGLRKKLGDYGKYIETIRGIGYRFRD